MSAATTEKTAPQGAGMRFTNAAASYIDERTSISGLVRDLPQSFS